MRGEEICYTSPQNMHKQHTGKDYTNGQSGEKLTCENVDAAAAHHMPLCMMVGSLLECRIMVITGFTEFAYAFARRTQAKALGTPSVWTIPQGRCMDSVRAFYPSLIAY